MELILNTYGVLLSRENDGFVICNAEGRQRIPAEGVSSIQVSRGAQISSDAVMLAVEREIEVLFVDKAGTVYGRIWSPRYGSVSTIRKGQLNFSLSKGSIGWIREVLCRKVENQQALLLMLGAGQEGLDQQVQKAVRRLEDYRTKLSAVDGEVMSDVAATFRGWEGVASKIYFDAINLFLPEAYRFENRSQHPATDVVNAMLNYGYGILYGKIEGDLIKAGLDPYIGVLHRDDYNRPVLVYDVIELYRVWVDYVVCRLVCQNVITDEYYSVRDDGSYWLEPLGRRVLIQSFNDYLEETVDVKGTVRSRQHQMFLYAQDLAQRMKGYC